LTDCRNSLKRNLKSNLNSKLVCLLLPLSVALAGCQGQKPFAGPSGPANPARVQKIVVEGSETMTALVRAWGKEFCKQHNELAVEMIAADTGSGINDLLDGKVNVAAASHQLSNGDQAASRTKQVRLTRTMVAKDAIAIVVDAANPVSALTMEELKGIFGGEIGRWSQVKSLPAAGHDKAIVAIGREAASGTGDFFREHILGGREFGHKVELALSSEAVLARVRGNTNAIGFVGMPQAEAAGKTVKVLTIKLNDASPADSGDGLSDSDYPLMRPLYLFYDPASDSAKAAGQARAFVEFCASEDGQKIVKDMGFMVTR
jgi:phosphate transport system substrate-binding protein